MSKSHDCDVAVVGGGIAGAALAQKLAARGLHVVVLERETAFKDRVRGEVLMPWGVAEAKALGLYDALREAHAEHRRHWLTTAGPAEIGTRDLEATCMDGNSMLAFYHPAMQESLLRLAGERGVEVRRGTIVESVTPGASPRIGFRENGEQRSLSARLVVGADGRNSAVRSWAGFEVAGDPDLLLIAGVLLDETPAPERAVYFAVGPTGGMFLAPLGKKRARAYFVSVNGAGLPPFSGKSRLPHFLEACRSTGVPSEWFADSVAAGPLAQFQGAAHWVTRPARDGVVLIGDAAAAPDPSWGCGLSLALMDARQLGDGLLSTPDWRAAADDYAREHDRYFARLHEIEAWWTQLIWTPGPEADARRMRLLPTLVTDPKGFPDHIGLGPHSVVDDHARAVLRGDA